MKILGLTLQVVVFLFGLGAIAAAFAALVFPIFQQAAHLLNN